MSRKTVMPARQVQRFVSPRRHPCVTALPPRLPSIVICTALQFAVAFSPCSRAGLWYAQLSITFGPIVGNAEHLAVLGRTFAAFAPRGNVVGVHFVELIDSALVRVVPNRAERTVGLALALGCLRLLSVCDLLYRCRRTPERPTTSYLPSRPRDTQRCPCDFVTYVIGGEPLHFVRHLLRIVGLAVVLLVQPAPLQASHFWENVDKHG